MAFNINDFRKLGLTGGGARPSLFEVVISPGIPEIADTTILSKFSFTCSASEIPAATIGSIDVAYFGRQIKLAGDRTFTDWNVTVLNDEDFSVRNMFEAWSNQMNQFVGNLKLSKGNSYKNGSAIVTQFGKSGDKLRSYEFVGIFPTNIANIGLDWDSTNRIQTFDVTFSYDYWVPLVTNTTLPIDTGMPGGTKAPQDK
jgi:hypothetical protein